MTELVRYIADSPGYWALMFFLGSYPVISALYWIVGSLVYSRNHERPDEAFYRLDEHPPVSVLVAAHNEEGVITETVECLLGLDWPDFEVVVVDDGSRDRTHDLLVPYAAAGRIRLVTKLANEGKAMALNDALPLLRGEIILVVDADGRPASDALRWIVPHFVRVPRVAAVTGNPRVANTSTLLAKLQAIEFTATVSVLRRAQATWGRLMTFSGISTALRKSAVESVGRFQPSMATEDIALAWALQAEFFDVRYEPRALFAMQVPETIGGWWRQRKRWARGLAQVLRLHGDVLTRWRTRRLWPVYLEAVASTAWSHLYLAAAGFWALAYGLGVYNFGANPVPNYWGMLIASVLVVQVTVGLALDGRYDPSVRRYVLWLPLFPLVYWALMATVSVAGTAGGLRARRGGPVRWQSARTAKQVQSAT